MNHSNPITRLPVETWLNISRFVKLEGLAAVSLTCRALHQIIPLSECLLRQCDVDALIRSYPRHKARLFHFLNCLEPVKVTELLYKKGILLSEPLVYEYLREHGDNVEPTKELAIQAIHYSSLRVLELLLPKFQTCEKSDYILNFACHRGNLEILGRILQEPDLCPDRVVLHLAATDNDSGVFELLLKRPKIVLAKDDFCIVLAAQKGRLASVKRLLQDGRIDPSAWQNLAVTRAFKKGHADVLALLLEDPRVDPAAITTGMIQKAVKDGRMDAVRAFLMDPRVQLSVSIKNHAESSDASKIHEETHHASPSPTPSQHHQPHRADRKRRRRRRNRRHRHRHR